MSTVELAIVDKGMPLRAQWPSRWSLGIKQHTAVVITLSMLGIGLISSYDFYLTITTAHCLPEFERNQMARSIMALDEPELQYERIALFLALKFAGTVVVLAVIGFLGMRSDRRAIPVSLGVFAFQLYLLYTLCVPT